MRTLRFCTDTYRSLWRVWSPLVLLTTLGPALAIGMTLLERRLVDDVIGERQVALLVPTVATYAGLWLLSTLNGVTGAFLHNYFNERLNQRVRQRLFAHSGALAVSFSQRVHSGRTMSLFASDSPTVAGLLDATVFGGLGSVIMLVSSGLLMFGLSWQLALVVAILPPVVGGLAAVLTRPLRPAARRVQDMTAELSQRIHDNLSGIREVIAFGREQLQASEFLTMQRQLLSLRMRLVLMDSGIQSGQALLSLVITLAILGYGGYLVIVGQLSLGTLFAVRSLFSFSFQSVGQLFGAVTAVQRGLASVDRVSSFLEERPLVLESAGACPPSNVRGTVAFEDVSFTYPNGTAVLQDVSFTARAGELIAIVGPSGAGKTTLASLMARFYDPSAGRVLVDATDIKRLTLEGLRRHIGIVFQDTFLFATSIRDNIALSREGASEHEIVEAARAANAWEFIEKLPSGLDTLVGQRGVLLSEGQKQRLAIARALLRDPRILILDEPTSALDARSEALLQEALNNLMLGRTTFVIAHRLATIQRADTILVLEQGRIVERGSHLELLRRGGLYAELCALQFGDQAARPGPVLERSQPGVLAGVA